MTKVCTCCGTTHDLAGWGQLPLVGYQHFPPVAGLPRVRLELRNCGCGSTLARKDHDDGKAHQSPAAA